LKDDFGQPNQVGVLFTLPGQGAMALAKPKLELIREKRQTVF
jgi:hypothetical protein